MPRIVNANNAPYVGGPLNGKSYEKAEPGPWQRARDVAGEPLKATDAVDTLCTAPAGVYLHTELFSEAERTMLHYYVHSSCIEGWLRWQTV